jgi:GTP-binding protein HflX
LIGAGKAEEIRQLIQATEAGMAIFDNPLSPSQIRVLEELLGVTVLDRSALILDIFAQRAKTAEGRLQVELAQYKYLLPRLSGMGISLSRQGGGIGTRGPGETQLETDRRHIRRRIKNLEDGLESLSRRRKLARERREKDEVETVAIVGYTNAGKSTLMNTLTQAGVLAEDKLFATLDPTSRALTLPDGRRVMLIDTVGFIRRLPHGLVEAFKSTLEEAASATLILNVCDASSPDCAEHLEVTNRLLEELGCKGKPIIAVFNKCDAAPDLSWLSAGLHSVKISALTGEGLDGLLNEMVRALPPTRKKVTLLLPYSMGSDAALLRKKGALDREEYRPDGLKMTVTADAKLLERYKDYII